MANPTESANLLAPGWRRSLAAPLLAWFERSARDLPWRRTSDLYAIWISEIMLQQTQVATVVGYFERFLARFPDIRSLAAADEQQVLRLWEGLGYYRRARQLHAAAKAIVAQHAGGFPTKYEAVRSLPGIGRYTAGAILSIGLDSRLPILEANTIRVLSRLTAYSGDPTSTVGQKHLWAAAEAILPAKRTGAFNQALMELGSEICTPKSPACDRCPVAALCEARRRGLVAQIPKLAKRMKYEEVTEAAVVIHDGDRVLLRHCQPGERWAGLWDFPRFAIGGVSGMNGHATREIASRTRDLVGFAVARPSQFATLKHGVTRFRITLHCYEAIPLSRGRKTPAKAATGPVRWVALGELPDYPLSVTGRKICGLLKADTNPKR